MHNKSLNKNTNMGNLRWGKNFNIDRKVTEDGGVSGGGGDTRGRAGNEQRPTDGLPWREVPGGPGPSADSGRGWLEAWLGGFYCTFS